MDFGEALKELKNGKAVTRTGWNGPGQCLQLQMPDKNSRMTLCYIFIWTAQKDWVPWIPSQTDLLAYDWELMANSMFQ